MHSNNIEFMINQIKKLVEANKRSEIKLNANGGNSILLVCKPSEELDYINAIYTQLPDVSFEILDINSLLIQFVQTNEDLINDAFDLLQGSVDQIFKLPKGDIGSDLFALIMDAIKTAFNFNKIPVLINTGAIYGSSIEYIQIVEHELVMRSPFPLVILYPATKDGDRLLFLSKRTASKYRCMIIN